MGIDTGQRLSGNAPAINMDLVRKEIKPMAGNIIEELLISVGLDTDEVNKGLNTLQDNMQRGFSNIVENVMAPALSMLGAFSAGEFLQQMNEEALSMQKYAQLVGMSTEEMSAWAGMADQFGVSADDLVDVLTDVNDKVTDLINNDAGPFKELMEQGIIGSFQNADGTLKSTEQIILELSDAVKKLGGQAGGGLLKRLGFNDPKMLAMLMQGGDALKEIISQMKEGGVYTDEDAKNAKEFNLAIKDMGRSLKMMLLPAFRLIAPLMAQAARALANLTNHAAAFIPVISGVAAMMTARLIPAAIKTGKELMAVFSIRRFALLGALAALGLVLDDFITWMQGGESAMGDFYTALFGNAEGAKEFLSSLLQFADAAAVIGGVSMAVYGLNAAITAVSGIMAVFGGVSLGTLGAIGAALAAVVVAAWELYQNWDTVTSAASEAWANFMGIVSSLWESVTSTIDGWIAGFSATFASIWEKIQAVREWAGNIASFAGYDLAINGGNSSSTQINQNIKIGDITATDPKGVTDGISETLKPWKFDSGDIVMSY